MKHGMSRRKFVAAAVLGGAGTVGGRIDDDERLALAAPEGASLATETGQDPMVAVNPKSGTVYLSWVDSGASSQAGLQGQGTPDAGQPLRVLVARSEDGGKSFGEPVLASGADSGVISYAGSSPLVVASPEGAVYTVYQRNVPHEGVDFGRDVLRLARSTNDGQSFEPAVDIFADTDALEAGTFHAAIVAPDGAVHVAWLSYRQYMPENAAGDDPKTEVRIARSDDGGTTFGPSVLVDDSSCECCRTSLAVDGEGVVYLAWRDRAEQPDEGDPVRNMVISRSADRGATWAPATPIHDDGWRVGQCPESGPVIAVDESKRVRAAWFTGKEVSPGVYYAASDDGGRTFSVPQTIASDTYFPHANVRASLDGGGAFWVTWDDPRTEAGRIGLVRIDERDGLVPGIAEQLAGRTSDVVASPEGPILAWVSDEGILVEPIEDGVVGS